MRRKLGESSECDAGAATAKWKGVAYRYEFCYAIMNPRCWWLHLHLVEEIALKMHTSSGAIACAKT
ncbi:hypothetical protein SESBI_45924 [Sesbania bispinosa]|nr:hypothetical protein SESBI_45924 [Sesbania bispinosa]